jgi:hypothetical protein
MGSLQMVALGSNQAVGVEIFLFFTASRFALETNHHPIQGVLGPVSLRWKQLDHEADSSPSSNAKIKNAWRYTSTPPYS